MSDYDPGWESQEYHRLSLSERKNVAAEVDKLFRAETGLTRQLHPRSVADRELRIVWLKLRDKVMQKREEEIQTEIDDMRRDGIVSEIPYEMESEGWPEAAELLRTWFERPPSIAPSYSAPVTNVIKMDWVLKFTRAKELYDGIMTDRIWTNDASKKRLKEFLKKKAHTHGERWGDLSQPVTTLDAEWVNSRSIRNGINYDGLAGALGSFTLQVVASGIISVVSKMELQLAITEIGVYVKDSFDFNGDQFLGVWGYRDDFIYNEDFRKWRAENGKGGDFRVFSDIKRTKLSRPDALQIFI